MKRSSTTKVKVSGQPSPPRAKKRLSGSHSNDNLMVLHEEAKPPSQASSSGSLNPASGEEDEDRGNYEQVEFGDDLLPVMSASLPSPSFGPPVTPTQPTATPAQPTPTPAQPTPTQQVPTSGDRRVSFPSPARPAPPPPSLEKRPPAPEYPAPRPPNRVEDYEEIDDHEYEPVLLTPHTTDSPTPFSDGIERAELPLPLASIRSAAAIRKAMVVGGGPRLPRATSESITTVSPPRHEEERPPSTPLINFDQEASMGASPGNGRPFSPHRPDPFSPPGLRTVSPAKSPSPTVPAPAPSESNHTCFDTDGIYEFDRLSPPPPPIDPPQPKIPPKTRKGSKPFVDQSKEKENARYDPSVYEFDHLESSLEGSESPKIPPKRRGAATQSPQPLAVQEEEIYVWDSLAKPGEASNPRSPDTPASDPGDDYTWDTLDPKPGTVEEPDRDLYFDHLFVGEHVGNSAEGRGGDDKRNMRRSASPERTAVSAVRFTVPVSQ